MKLFCNSLRINRRKFATTRMSCGDSVIIGSAVKKACRLGQALFTADPIIPESLRDILVVANFRLLILRELQNSFIFAS